MLGDKKANIQVGGNFDPIPVDKYTVQINDVDLVTQFNKFKQEEQELLKYQYVILDDKPMGDGDSTKHRFLWHRVSQTLSSKSWLMRLAKAVYGRDLTREEMEAFDPEALVGKQVDVMVNQKPSADGSAIYNNVIDYSKTVKKLDPYMEVAGGPVTVEKKTETVADREAETNVEVDVPEVDFETLDDAFDEKKTPKKTTTKKK